MFSQPEAYERFMGRWSRLLAPALVAFAEVRDGDVVLDLGCGTGSLSFAVRDATRTARIAGVDSSPDYVAYVARRSADPRVHFEVGDARKLEHPDAVFDKALALLVINFVPGPADVVKEMMRVTRSGGVVSAAVWDYGEGMQMLRVFWDEAAAFEPTLERHDEARMPLCKRGALGTLWRREGLQDVQEAPLTVELNFASFEDFWAPFLLGQGPAGALVATLPEELRAKLRERLRKRLLAGVLDRPFALRARAWAVKGSVPGASRG